MQTREAYYPVNRNEIHFTPVAVAPDDRAKIIPAHELKEGQIGFLLIDIPQGKKGPDSVDQAIRMVNLDI